MILHVQGSGTLFDKGTLPHRYYVSDSSRFDNTGKIVSNTCLTVIACRHLLSMQGVFLWLEALTQGEHARPAKMGVELPREPYRAGVSGPNSTNVGRGVMEEKWPGPESLVTMRMAVE